MLLWIVTDNLYYPATDLLLIWIFSVITYSNQIREGRRKKVRGRWGERGMQRKKGRDREGEAEGEGDFCVNSCWEEECQLVTSYVGSFYNENNPTSKLPRFLKYFSPILFTDIYMIRLSPSFKICIKKTPYFHQNSLE